MDKKFLSSTERPELPAPTKHPIQWLKQPGRKDNHSSPPSVKIRNEWSYTSTPQYAFVGVDRDNFYLYIHEKKMKISFSVMLNI
jgi:hypothetical protein